MQGPRFLKFARGFALTAVCFFSGLLAAKIHAITGYSNLIWMPTGFALTALVLFGSDLWPWVWLGGTLLSLSRGSSLLASLVVGIGATLECYVGSYFLKRFASPRVSFSKLRDALVFIGLVMGVAGALGATVEVPGLYWAGRLPHGNLWHTWLSWWMSAALANLTIAGFFIGLRNDFRYKLRQILGARVEWSALLASTLVICVINFTPLSRFNQLLILRPFILYSFMMWAALRFNLLGATTSNVLVAVTMIFGTLAGFTPFNTTPVEDRMALLQIYVLVLGTVGLVLGAAVREKELAVEARNEFLSIATHELKTPITSLKLNLQLAQKELIGTPGRTVTFAEQLQFSRKIERQVDHLTQTIEQLLDVSTVERKDLSLDCENVDLTALVKELTERLAGPLESARCRLDLALQPGIVGYWAPFRMQQVLENIITNAIKYAPGKPIRITTSENEGKVAIVIADGGPGIERSLQSRIFDRFVRGEVSHRTKGLGLGLFITRKIVEAHRGSIHVESDLGQGTRFVIEIPLSALPPVAAGETKPLSA